jgi:glycosyltransferase involved in cell wall biosynthesis
MHVLLTGNTAFKIANFRQGLVRYLIAQGHRVTVLAPADDYVDALRAMGCDFVPITMNRNGTAIFEEIRLVYDIFMKIRRLKPDVVFSYTIKNNIYGGLACRILKIPAVPNVTGLGPAFNAPGLLNRIVRVLYSVAFHKVYRVFFQNPNDLETFVEAGLIDADRAELLPGSGVDLKAFAQTPMPTDPSERRFLLVARMLWDKGVGVFVEAAEKVRARHPDARFQLLGSIDAESRSGITQPQIEEWVSSGAIEYLGVTKEVLPVLQQAHCVVLPSFYREGTPRSLLEAGAVGRPIITTDMPGCRDLVVQDRNGFLVAPQDADDLATAMSAFLDLDPAVQAAFGAASRNLIEDRYDEKIVIDAYGSIVADLARDSASASVNGETV